MKLMKQKSFLKQEKMQSGTGFCPLGIDWIVVVCYCDLMWV